MHWLSIIIIGFASNIDNLGIGLSYGTRSTRIPIMSNLFIAILAMLAAYLSVTMGQFISGYLSKQHADLIGGIVIIGLGLWSMKTKPTDELPAKLTSPSLLEANQGRTISWKESISLGVALSLNCMATGFGAGVSGVPPTVTAISVGVFSLVTVAVGVRIGHQIARTWLGKYSSIIGGAMLIGIGLYEIFV